MRRLRRLTDATFTVYSLSGGPLQQILEEEGLAHKGFVHVVTMMELKQKLAMKFEGWKRSEEKQHDSHLHLHVVNSNRDTNSTGF